MKKYCLGFVLLCVLGVIACRKKELPKPNEPVVNPSDKGSMKIKLSNVVGDEPLVLGDSVSYSLANGDEFNVSTYNYYLSNFVFIDDKGNRFVEPESYHLAMAMEPESLEFVVKNIPVGNYASVEFMIGVDSVRNFSGAQDGALDPKYGMIWSWSTGYIMAKMEGKALPAGSSISYHIAGYKGAYNVLQNVKLTLPNNAIVTSDKMPLITMQSDLESWFQGFSFPGFAKLPSIGVEGPNAFQMALSYSTMMSIKSVENP